jgi:hypothetical protein
MNDFDGNYSLNLEDVLIERGGGRPPKPKAMSCSSEDDHQVSDMSMSSTAALAREARAEALFMVLEGSDAEEIDADMLAKQMAAAGRVNAPSSNYESSSEDFDVSSTTRFAEAGQKAALTTVLDIEEDEIAKQQARWGRGASSPGGAGMTANFADSVEERVSTLGAPRRAETSSLREQTNFTLVCKGQHDDNVASVQVQSASAREQIPVAPGAYSVAGAQVVTRQHIGVLTDARSEEAVQGSLKATVPALCVVGAVTEEGGVRAKEQAKKDYLPFSDVEIANVSKLKSPKGSKSLKWWIIGLIVSILVVAAVAAGIAVGRRPGGGSTNEPQAAQDECDFTLVSDPSVDLQCSCYGKVTSLSEETMARLNEMKSTLEDSNVPFESFSETEGWICSNSDYKTLYRLAQGRTVDSSDSVAVTEHFALTVLMENSGQAQWPLNTWVSSDPLCTWERIDCQDQKVSGLNLTKLGLQGTITPHLSLLSSLKTLDLSTNSFTGTIPNSIIYLSALEDLNLGTNALEGELPSEIGLATSLKSLDVSGNNFGGKIPSEISGLVNLETLNLQSNQNMGGYIPTELALLQTLKSLRLGGMWNLRGVLPSEFGTLTSLTRLEFSMNDVSGSIPSEMGNMVSLEVLILASTKIGGSVPSELGQLSSLKVLLLGSDRTSIRLEERFSGEIPEQLWNLTSLEILDIGGQMNINGTLPGKIFDLNNLKSARFRLNHFSGGVPDQLSAAENLECLDISGNPQLVGPLPFGVCEGKRLEVVVDCTGWNLAMLQGCDCCHCGNSTYDPCKVWRGGIVQT